MPTRLNDLRSEMNELEPSEKLEWLIDFAGQLPEVSPERQQEALPEACRVQECQTPVHLWVTVVDGQIHLEAHVPRKSPTVRGLVAMVVCGLEGASVADGLSLPDDMVMYLGLSTVLGMTRQQGFRGVISRIKRELRAATD